MIRPLYLFTSAVFFTLALITPAHAEQVSFSGVTGACKAGPPCQDINLGILAGTPFTGSFTYSGFAFPSNTTFPAAQVSNFTVTFPNVTLTATTAALFVSPHDGDLQYLYVTGTLPSGATMTIGLASFAFPPRTDLMNPSGIVWNCGEWGFCGFRISLVPLGLSPLNLSAPGVIAIQDQADPNGTLTMSLLVAEPCQLPAAQTQVAKAPLPRGIIRKR